MNGFVSIDSIKNYGTTVRVSVIQEVLDPTPCLALGTREFLGVAFHVLLDRFSTSQVPEFYKTMATNMASGLRVNLYSAPTLSELKKLLDTGKLTHVFMGPDEYEEASAYFDEIAKDEVTVIVSADKGYAVNPGSRVIVMPKPLYGYPVVKILNGETKAIEFFDGKKQNDLNLEGVRVLVVDDEPMNLVVATGLFRDYKMEVDTAESGREALNKYDIYDYDIVFMDHMMPEMDGVETMKRMRFISDQKGKPLKVVALTANAVSGAREMFLKEGFDGFITKPININDFERVISRVLSEGDSARSGGVK